MKREASIRGQSKKYKGESDEQNDDFNGGEAMQKCEECLYSRPIISENDYHAVCCLSQKKAMDCMMGKKSHFATVKKDDGDHIKE